MERRVAATAKERRKRLIEKQLVRIIEELQKKSLAQSLFAWHVWVANKIRIRIVAAKAEVVVANRTLRASFGPWLLAARTATAFGQQRTIVTLQEREEEQRKRSIQKEVVRRMFNIQHGAMLHAFDAWHDRITRKLRIRNLQKKALMSI